MATKAPETDGRRTAAATRRRARENEIIEATRALFDQRGVRDAQVEDVAQAVGINRTIIYRHFSGKEELFALTLVSYLRELREVLIEGDAPFADGADPRARISALVSVFVDYGVAHPAFVDCAQSLMGRTGDELVGELSESALFRLGQGLSGCLSVVSIALEDGAESGHFTLATDPALLANIFYATGLGALQLARMGILVKESGPGVPTVGQVSADEVRAYLVASALAIAGAV